jgi:hypothetical protein
LGTAALDDGVSKYKILERMLVEDKNNIVPCDGFQFVQLQERNTDLRPPRYGLVAVDTANRAAYRSGSTIYCMLKQFGILMSDLTFHKMKKNICMFPKTATGTEHGHNVTNGVSHLVPKIRMR